MVYSLKPTTVPRATKSAIGRNWRSWWSHGIRTEHSDRPTCTNYIPTTNCKSKDNSQFGCHEQGYQFGMFWQFWHFMCHIMSHAAKIQPSSAPGRTQSFFFSAALLEWTASRRHPEPLKFNLLTGWGYKNNVTESNVYCITCILYIYIYVFFFENISLIDVYISIYICIIYIYISFKKNLCISTSI